MTSPIGNPEAIFPEVIDSSIRSQFVSCPRSYLWRYGMNLRLAGESVHLKAGGAFAAGCESIRKGFYDEGLSSTDAIERGCNVALEHYGETEIPDDHPKSPSRVIAGLIHYFTTYPLATDACQPIKTATGKHCIEFKFAIPLPFTHPTTGNPLLFGGRSDMLVNFNGMQLVFDDKTTSQLGATWPGSWNLRGQIDGYVYAARHHGIPVEGAIIRGQSFLKKSFGNAESLQLRSDWQIQRWYEQFLRDIERMLSAWRSGIYDYNLDSTCSSYGNCAYQALCSSPNPERWFGDYVKEVWNPLHD